MKKILKDQIAGIKTPKEAQKLIDAAKTRLIDIQASEVDIKMLREFDDEFRKFAKTYNKTKIETKMNVRFFGKDYGFNVTFTISGIYIDYNEIHFELNHLSKPKSKSSLSSKIQDVLDEIFNDACCCNSFYEILEKESKTTEFKKFFSELEKLDKEIDSFLKVELNQLKILRNIKWKTQKD